MYKESVYRKCDRFCSGEELEFSSIELLVSSSKYPLSPSVFYFYFFNLIFIYKFGEMTQSLRYRLADEKWGQRRLGGPLLGRLYNGPNLL